MVDTTRYDSDARSLNDDLIDPDDDILNDLDDPLTSRQSERTPLSDNAGAQGRGNGINQSYLTSSIPGEDRRAPVDTLDETVWETLSRDLSAVWEKLKLVLWPNMLLGGLLRRRSGGPSDIAERGDAVEGLASGVRTFMGRWPVDADTVLQGAMSEGLRDWDLWGPLLFCLLLSLFLSIHARDQKATAFSGIFAIIWIGEAVVTLQIKLLGGNISFFQSVCIIGYTLFPLVIASVLSALNLFMIARIPICIVLVLWSLAAGISILGGSGVLKNRVGLAVYPLFVYYVGLGCLCLVS